MEYLPCFLSGRSARRLLLRAFLDTAAWPEASSASTHRSSGIVEPCPAASASDARRATSRCTRHPLDSCPPSRIAWTDIRHAGQRSTCRSALAGRQRPPASRESIFPLRSEQRRQPDCSAELSTGDRILVASLDTTRGLVRGILRSHSDCRALCMGCYKGRT